MTRNILIAFSLLIAADEFSRSWQVYGTSVTGHILGSLVYASVPAMLGLIVALIKVTFAKWRGWPSAFQKDWNWAWAIFLILFAASHLVQQIKT